MGKAQSYQAFVTANPKAAAVILSVVASALSTLLCQAKLRNISI